MRSTRTTERTHFSMTHLSASLPDDMAQGAYDSPVSVDAALTVIRVCRCQRLRFFETLQAFFYTPPCLLPFYQRKALRKLDKRRLNLALTEMDFREDPCAHAKIERRVEGFAQCRPPFRQLPGQTASSPSPSSDSARPAYPHARKCLLAASLCHEKKLFISAFRLRVLSEMELKASEIVVHRSDQRKMIVQPSPALSERSLQ